jgi:hypothetical protein
VIPSHRERRLEHRNRNAKAVKEKDYRVLKDSRDNSVKKLTHAVLAVPAVSVVL